MEESWIRTRSPSRRILNRYRHGGPIAGRESSLRSAYAASALVGAGGSVKLNQFAAEWSKQENLIVEQLQEAFRRGDTEDKTEDSNKEHQPTVQRVNNDRHTYRAFREDQ